ncbi:hypothetical protein [Halorhabdus rudnickae]|uniref:hypothetical protein n=1 Tax=Halorhabdus rudnickae TaxID=1775544 RepID=UPI0010842DEE|nr:hypothetical protein [Halorhabdus rudnickae]
MVEDRITDGERIAEVFRAEIAGRETGGLDRLSITEDGTTTVLLDGAPLATVEPGENGLEIRFQRAKEMVRTTAGDAGLETRSENGPVTIVVESAAATKRATDLLATIAERIE